MTSALNEEIVLKTFHFPKSGDTYDGSTVTESSFNIDDGSWFVMYDRKVSSAYIRRNLKHLIGASKFFTPDGDKVYEVTVDKAYKAKNVRTNPSSGDRTLVVGTVGSSRVWRNPTTVEEFDAEMDDMVQAEPDKSFRRHKVGKLESAKGREKLWSFVSFVGESYGWYKNGEIYHRTGSLIAPKVNITKKVENARTFYHTHPSMDEPSQTSADDIQLYLDCAFSNDYTTNFYTVMKDRMEHFIVKTKKGMKDAYLKIDEDKLMKDIESIMDANELELRKEYGPKDRGLQFSSEVTRNSMKEINDRYADYFTISYRNHYRPGVIKSNPDGGAAFLENPPSQIEEFQSLIDNNEYLKGNTVTPTDLVQSDSYVLFFPSDYVGHIKSRHLDPNAPGSLFTQDVNLQTVAATVMQHSPDENQGGRIKWLGTNSGQQIGYMGVAAAQPETVSSYEDYTMTDGRNEQVKVLRGQKRAPTNEVSLVTSELGPLSDGRTALSIITMFPGGEYVSGVRIPVDRNDFTSAGLYFVLPNPPIKVKEKYTHPVFDELKDTSYNQEHYGANEYGHSLWVYWWLDYHFAIDKPSGSKMWTLERYGLDSSLRNMLRDYLGQELAPSYSYLDVALIMGLYHDVGKKREKELGRHHSVVGAEMFQSTIAPDNDIPKDIADAITLMMESDIGRRDINEEDFRNMVGGYYGVALLVRMADMAAHHPHMFIGSARRAKMAGDIESSNALKYKDSLITEHFTNLRTFLDYYSRTNPPPVPNYISYKGDYEVNIDFILAESGLSKYNFKEYPQGGQANFKYEHSLGTVNGKLYPRGVIQIDIKKNHMTEQDPLGDTLAQQIFVEIGEAIANFQPDNVPVIAEVKPQPLINPRHTSNVKLITLSGPSGTGKSTFLRTIVGELNASMVPTYTSRPKRPKEKPGGDRVFVKKEKFIEMVKNDEFVEYQKEKNGHFYGRRWADFEANKYAVVDVTLSGMKTYREKFPFVYSAFLFPDVSKKEMFKRLIRRGGMTEKEAKRRVRIAGLQIKQAKQMPFDLFLQTKSGHYEEQATELSEDVKNFFAKPVEKNPQTNLDGDDFPDDIHDFISRRLAEGWKTFTVERWMPDAVIPDRALMYPQSTIHKANNVKVFVMHPEDVEAIDRDPRMVEAKRKHAIDIKREKERKAKDGQKRRERMGIQSILDFVPDDDDGRHSPTGSVEDNPKLKMKSKYVYKEGAGVPHKQVKALKPWEEGPIEISVDELMAPLLMHLWDNGVQTLFSCQGAEFDDPEWIHHPRVKEMEERGEVFLPPKINSYTSGYILMEDGSDYVAYRMRDLLWNHTKETRLPSSFESPDAYRNGAEIWLDAEYHRWGKMRYPDFSLTLNWRGRPDHENLRHIYDAFGLDFPNIETKDNPKKKCTLPLGPPFVSTILDFENDPDYLTFNIPAKDLLKLHKHFGLRFPENTTSGGTIPEGYSEEDFGYSPLNQGSDYVPLKTKDGLFPADWRLYSFLKFMVEKGFSPEGWHQGDSKKEPSGRSINGNQPWAFVAFPLEDKKPLIDIMGSIPEFYVASDNLIPNLDSKPMDWKDNPPEPEDFTSVLQYRFAMTANYPSYSGVHTTSDLAVSEYGLTPMRSYHITLIAGNLLKSYKAQIKEKQDLLVSYPPPPKPELGDTGVAYREMADGEVRQTLFAEVVNQDVFRKYTNDLCEYLGIPNPDPNRFYHMSLANNHGGDPFKSVGDIKPSDLVRSNPKKAWPSNYRHAAGCVVMKKGKILMLRRSHKETSKHGLWELPGGKLEKGETPRQAASNETLEEAGLKVKITKKLVPHIDHNMEKVYHGFLAEPVDSDARVRLSEEHDRNKWVSLDRVIKWTTNPKKKISHHAVFLFSQLKLMGM